MLGLYYCVGDEEETPLSTASHLHCHHFPTYTIAMHIHDDNSAFDMTDLDPPALLSRVSPSAGAQAQVAPANYSPGPDLLKILSKTPLRDRSKSVYFSASMGELYIARGTDRTGTDKPGSNSGRFSLFILRLSSSKRTKLRT